jgi:tetratricopeptide (TPR) repeat protein
MVSSSVRRENLMNKRMISGSLAIIASIIFSLFVFAIAVEGSTVNTNQQYPQNKAEAASDKVQLEQYLVGVMTGPKHVYESYKEVSSQLAREYTKVARAYSDHAQYERGIPWANKALRMDPSSPEAHLVSGWLNQRVRKMDEAFAAYEKTIELDPSNFEAHLYLGIMYIGRGNHSLGIDYANQAMELAQSLEEISIAYTHRGHGYAGLAQYEQAFSDLDRALSLDANNFLAIWIRGIVAEVVAESDNPVSDQEGDLGIEEGLSFGS